MRGPRELRNFRDGRVLQELHAESPDQSFGTHVCSAGDVDGDGYADTIVGSPGKEGAPWGGCDGSTGAVRPGAGHRR